MNWTEDRLRNCSLQKSTQQAGWEIQNAEGQSHRTIGLRRDVDAYNQRRFWVLIDISVVFHRISAGILGYIYM